MSLPKLPRGHPLGGTPPEVIFKVTAKIQIVRRKKGQFKICLIGTIYWHKNTNCDYTVTSSYEEKHLATIDF